MLSPQDVGARVSVRRALAGGGFTDVLGVLVSWQDGRLRIRRADDEEVWVDESTVVAGRPVPPAPPRRAPGVPHVTPAQMQRICGAGFPAREQEPLGDWLLRAHAGITGRANSVMAVGDPGLPLDEALDVVVRWYAARGLPPLVQLPQADPLDAELAARGWHTDHVTIVQTAPIGATLSRIPPRPDLTVSVGPAPDREWLALMHDLDAADPQAHLAILTGPARVGFAVLRDGAEPVGIGRVSIEGPWAGVTSVDVAPGRRREGIGTAVMRALLEWAGSQGARAAYLQVRAHNEPALALYDRLGFVTHHSYGYRALRG
jgi:N-acetylglutamate synthase